MTDNKTILSGRINCMDFSSSSSDKVENIKKVKQPYTVVDFGTNY